MHKLMIKWTFVLVLLAFLKQIGILNQSALQSLKSIFSDPQSSLVSNSTPMRSNTPDDSIDQEMVVVNNLKMNPKLNPKFLAQLVDELFYQRHPELYQRRLTNAPDPVEAKLRAEWTAIAKRVTNRLTPLSVESIHRLGTYGAADYNHWLTEARQYPLSPVVINHLADNRFYRWFPEQQGRHLKPSTMGQIWFAIVEKILQSVRTGTVVEVIRVDSLEKQKVNAAANLEVSDEAYSTCDIYYCKLVRASNLKPDEAKVYVIHLNQNQFIQLDSLETRQTSLTLYAPNGKSLFRSPPYTGWSGVVQEPGFYEFAMISNSLERIYYRLRLTVNRNAVPKPLDFSIK